MPAWSRSTRPCMCSPIASMSGRRRRISRRRSLLVADQLKRRSEDRLCPHHVPGRRLRRQRRRRHRRHPSGGRDLQAGRQAGEGDLVARGRPGAGQAASARGRQAHARPSATTACPRRCSPARRGSSRTATRGSAARPPTTASTTCRTRFPHRHHERHDVEDSHPELDASRARRQPARLHGRESSSTRWRSRADGIRSNGASR